VTRDYNVSVRTGQHRRVCNVCSEAGSAL